MLESYLCSSSLIYVLTRLLMRLIDVDQSAWEYMRRTKADANVGVKTPRKMVTCSQTRAVVEDRLDVQGARLDP
jgi:hypothetical protein